MGQAAVTHDSAQADAAAAARRAGVTVRALAGPPALRQVAELFSRVWHTPVPPFPHDLMCSLAHAGGRVFGAFRDGQLLGAAVAVFGPPAARSSYSLVTGVSPRAERGGIGLALKLTQRAWALGEGAASMRWTFDPLLRRNAGFNITRLGATADEYLRDFYGDLGDGVNDPVTDRLTVTWDLRMPLPDAGAGPGAAAGEETGTVVLGAGPAGEPVPSGPRAGGHGVLRCWVPDNILDLRRSDPELAARWRLAMREALGTAIGDGYRVTQLLKPGWYVLERAGAGR